jgi:hypothetical protein
MVGKVQSYMLDEPLFENQLRKLKNGIRVSN